MRVSLVLGFAPGNGGWILPDWALRLQRMATEYGVAVSVDESPRAGVDLVHLFDSYLLERFPESIPGSVCTVHSLGTQFDERSPERRGPQVRDAAAVSAVCPEQARWLAEASGRTVHVTPVGISEAFRPAPRDRERRPVVLVGGRHYPAGYKGDAWRRDALLLLRQRGVDFGVRFVGSRWQDEQAWCQAHAIPAEVLERGRDYLAPDDEAKYYAGCAVYLCTSIVDSGPVPALQALAAGVPVVTTPVGLIQDRAARPGCGRVVPWAATGEPDAGGLADAVAAVLAGDHGEPVDVARSVSDLTWRASTERFLHLYRAAARRNDEASGLRTLGECGRADRRRGGSSP